MNWPIVLALFSGANLIALLTFVWSLSSRLTALEESRKYTSEDITEMKADIKTLLRREQK
jgi:hypothetical protein